MILEPSTSELNPGLHWKLSLKKLSGIHNFSHSVLFLDTKDLGMGNCRSLIQGGSLQPNHMSLVSPVLHTEVSVFYVGLPEESIFLTTIYGLYFSHHYTHITNYNLSLILVQLVLTKFLISITYFHGLFWQPCSRLAVFVYARKSLDTEVTVTVELSFNHQSLYLG